MDWLNYHHLLYFWTVAKAGGIRRAAQQLHLAQPTLSSQITKLEQSIGTALFDRSGRSLVLTDSPLTPDTHVRAFNHLLGECGITVFGAQDLAKKYGRDFPASLDGAPMLLPTKNTSLRRALEQWFDEQQIHPRVMHEFEDSAVLKALGQAGEGLFVAPTTIENEVCRQYSVRALGHIPAVKERFYAISIERRLRHPAALAISTAARKQLT